MPDVAHYRAPMRSRLDTVDPSAGVERGLALGLCGVGGRLLGPPPGLPEALITVARAHGQRVADRLRRFAAVEDGAVMWTRGEDGRLYRGLLTGPWRFDSSAAAYEADLSHVRPCSWSAVPDARAPAPVVEAFERGGRNFQRITRL